MSRLLGRELRLSVWRRLLSTGSNWRGTVVDIGLRVWDGLLVRMHSEAVVAWRRPWWGRGIEVALGSCGLFAVCHDEELWWFIGLIKLGIDSLRYRHKQVQDVSRDCVKIKQTGQALRRGKRGRR